MSNLYYRIGPLEATLLPFFARGLPAPTQAIYRNHTTRSPQGGGGEGRHGYNQAEILWDILTADQANIIEDLITTVEATAGQGNATLWLTLPQTDAEPGGASWIDISGIAIMPQWNPAPQSNGLLYENVILRLNNCTEQNIPSTVQS